MAYCLRREDSSVKEGIRRIACEQIDGALELTDMARDQGEAVHNIRLQCKKIRGLVRLVRPVFGGYARENATFRDIAGLLSGVRDAKVLQDTCDKLADSCVEPAECRALEQIRKHCSPTRDVRRGQREIGQRFEQIRMQLAEARDRAQRWKLKEKGWNAISEGLSSTYGQAGMVAKNARKAPTTENYHELRKQLKYHWYHLRLLRQIAPAEMNARSRAAKQISDLLGEHHDLFVFADWIKHKNTGIVAQPEADLVHALAHRQREFLEEKAWSLVDRLLDEPPDVLAERWHLSWRAWRKGQET